ncbi:hypothetical protein HanXRQr2_Chr12g0524881 [Helianthus annuus]|uniref:Uncharacterized protein n=1 Tax=Helianthus annuus TaxID=4232 RepID=A0A9K3EN98_HELAN|nr:hypothetical protein HanXRQr2_Chr12g0524881 [Helianthus annuus]KAJ0861354.1 hypothetical protein HanPSC8_Chr12g0505731 [Helianthus annuus]
MVPSQTLVHAKSHKLKVKINSKSKSEHEIVISIEKEQGIRILKRTSRWRHALKGAL